MWYIFVSMLYLSIFVYWVFWKVEQIDFSSLHSWQYYLNNNLNSVVSVKRISWDTAQPFSIWPEDDSAHSFTDAEFYSLVE